MRSKPTKRDLIIIVQQRVGPIGRWNPVAKDKIQDVFPHLVKNGMNGYRAFSDPSLFVPFMERVERGLNRGMLASEAEVGYALAKYYDNPIFRVIAIKPNTGRRHY